MRRVLQLLKWVFCGKDFAQRKSLGDRDKGSRQGERRLVALHRHHHPNSRRRSAFTPRLVSSMQISSSCSCQKSTVFLAILRHRRTLPCIISQTLRSVPSNKKFGRKLRSSKSLDTSRVSLHRSPWRRCSSIVGPQEECDKLLAIEVLKYSHMAGRVV
jgi:hypothetical protein